MCHEVTLTLITHSPDETRVWGVELGRRLEPGQVVALYGDLGAGKTTLTQAIVIGLGSSDLATSPTFTLVNEYRGRAGLRIFHIDAYRLGENAAHEAEASGIAELLDDATAVIIIEWPERLVGLLPDDCLVIHLHATDSDANTRRIECRGRALASFQGSRICLP